MSSRRCVAPRHSNASTRALAGHPADVGVVERREPGRHTVDRIVKARNTSATSPLAGVVHHVDVQVVTRRHGREHHRRIGVVVRRRPTSIVQANRVIEASTTFVVRIMWFPREWSCIVPRSDHGLQRAFPRASLPGVQCSSPEVGMRALIYRGCRVCGVRPGFGHERGPQPSGGAGASRSRRSRGVARARHVIVSSDTSGSMDVELETLPRPSRRSSIGSVIRGRLAARRGTGGSGCTASGCVAAGHGTVCRQVR